MPKIRTLIIWDNLADYHYHRLMALDTNLSAVGFEYVAMELVRKNSSHPWASQFVPLGLKVLRISQGEPRGILLWCRLACSLFWEMQKCHADVVFVPSYSPARPAMVMLAAKLIGARLVMMNDSHANRAAGSRIKEELKKISLRLFDSAFVAGSAQLRYFEFLGFDRRNMSIGYDAVDGHRLREVSDSILSKDIFLAKYRPPKNYILSIGRLIPPKNHSVLVTAYVEICKSDVLPLPALVLVGEGPEKELLRSYLRSLNFPFFEYEPGGDFTDRQSCVCFYPFCPNSDTAHFYGGTGLFVLPSTEETWGLVVSEAVAVGVPVLVSNNAGCVDDLVHDGVNGGKFDPKSVVELRSALRKFFYDEEWRQSVVAGALRIRHCIVIDHFVNGYISAARMATRGNFDGATI